MSQYNTNVPFECRTLVINQYLSTALDILHLRPCHFQCMHHPGWNIVNMKPVAVEAKLHEKYEITDSLSCRGAIELIPQ